MSLRDRPRWVSAARDREDVVLLLAAVLALLPGHDKLPALLLHVGCCIGELQGGTGAIGDSVASVVGPALGLHKLQVLASPPDGAFVGGGSIEWPSILGMWPAGL